MSRISQIHEFADTLLMLREAKLAYSHAAEAVMADLHEMIRAEEAEQNAASHEWPASWPAELQNNGCAEAEEDLGTSS